MEARGFEYDRSVAALEKPRNAAQVWREILSLFQVTEEVVVCTESDNEPLGPEELRDLVDAIKKECKNERDFSQTLFAALRKCLEGEHLIETFNDTESAEANYIVFKYGRTKGYYFKTAKNTKYFASVKNATVGIETDSETESDSGTDTECVDISGAYAICIAQETTLPQSALISENFMRFDVSPNSRLDHCCCLLKQTIHGKWQVREYLSAIKLNISGADTCAVFDSDKKIEASLDLAGRHGALSQVMSNAMACVLPSHARLGGLGNEIPWAIVVGRQAPCMKTMKARHNMAQKRRRKGKAPKTIERMETTNRWVSGKIVIPAKCGNPFRYAVTGFGPMEVWNDDTVMGALAAYLEIILFGLRAAKQHMDAMRQKRRPQPLAVTGKDVVIGKQLLPVTLRVSSAMGMYPTCKGGHFAQGEIFTGRLNMHVLLESLSDVDKEDNCIIFNNDNEEVDVVVKVWSQAVHDFLTKPEHARRALTGLSKHEAGKEISKVLYAIYSMPRGSITIMANLKLQGYEVLKPATNASLAALWKGFQEVVVRVLLPMASRGWIHPDIRPGFDVTSNILCNIEQKGDIQSVTMQVINFECIVALRDWKVPHPSDYRYIWKQSNWNGVMFLWWQCLAVAYAWAEQKSQLDMKNEDFTDNLNGISPVAWAGVVSPDVATESELTVDKFKVMVESLGTLFIK